MKTTNANVIKGMLSSGTFAKCEHTGYFWNKVGTHKYEVKAVSHPASDASAATVRTYYVDSIAQLEHLLNEGNDYIRKNYSGSYTTIKGDYVTAHYATRIY